MAEEFTTLRMQYAEDLEDILQCPVCLEIPKSYILTCIKGHHICKECKMWKGIKLCPICESKFYDSRNYLGESLAAKFNDIKFSLLNPNNYINRRVKKKSIGVQNVVELTIKQTQTKLSDNISIHVQTYINQISCASQTEINRADAETQTENCTVTVPHNINDTIATLKEVDLNNEKCEIPCIIKTCTYKFCYNNLLHHLKTDHEENLIQKATCENGLFYNLWNFLYETNNSFDYIINIQNMGLLFFNVTINENGDLFSNIRFIEIYRDCTEKTLYYIILISNKKSALLSETFKGIILSHLRDENNNENQIFISKLNLLQILFNESESFVCSLTIYQPEKYEN